MDGLIIKQRENPRPQAGGRAPACGSAIGLTPVGPLVADQQMIGDPEPCLLIPVAILNPYGSFYQPWQIFELPRKILSLSGLYFQECLINIALSSYVGVLV